MPLRRSELDEERNLQTESRLLSPNISVDPKSRNALDENELLSPNRSLGKLYLTKLEPKKEEDDFKSWDFVLAIFYILFGIIALIAGMLSILSQ